MKKKNQPGWHGGPCGRPNRENRERRPCNPDSTCYIRFCVHPHVIGIEQRSVPSAVVSTMEATYNPPHLVLQLPTIQKSDSKQSNTGQPRTIERENVRKLLIWGENCFLTIIRLFLGLISRTLDSWLSIASLTLPMKDWDNALFFSLSRKSVSMWV